ncbi:hypothetical protein AB0L47_24480 [Streptomyces bobili]|uniref:hypothetical protein n=1 Tax=Streptomyces bobili TaxID=67280 RepID=UPI00343CF56C
MPRSGKVSAGAVKARRPCRRTGRAARLVEPPGPPAGAGERQCDAGVEPGDRRLCDLVAQYGDHPGQEALLLARQRGDATGDTELAARFLDTVNVI